MTLRELLGIIFVHVNHSFQLSEITKRNRSSVYLNLTGNSVSFWPDILGFTCNFSTNRAKWPKICSIRRSTTLKVESIRHTEGSSWNLGTARGNLAQIQITSLLGFLNGQHPGKSPSCFCFPKELYLRHTGPPGNTQPTRGPACIPTAGLRTSQRVIYPGQLKRGAQSTGSW